MSNLTNPQTSVAVRRAVIDIGTNSVKLLVADVFGFSVTPVLEDSKQTRLGEGFYETYHLQAGAIAATAHAVAKFAAQSRALGVTNLRGIATSATRDALNASELVSAIRSASGLSVEIISGEQEAEWVFQGVSSDPKLAGPPLLILDVGGGSTEFILGQNKRSLFINSFPLGTLRLLEQLHPGDPPGLPALEDCRARLKEFLRTQITVQLVPILQTVHKPVLIGTGGTATIMARLENQMPDFDRDKIQGTRLTATSVRNKTEELWQIPLAERKKIIGLPPKRADIILTGLAIFESVMEHFGFDELRVSTRGLRYAAVCEL